VTSMDIRGARRGTALLAVALLLGAGCTTPGQREQTRQDARKATSHLEIGMDHRENGRPALAMREYLTAERLDPRNPRIQYAIGEAYMARGDFAEAETHLRRALELNPDDQEARITLSGLLIGLERYEEAIAECDRLIDDATYPSPWAALSNKAWAELRLGRPAEARETLQLALELRAGYWPATLTLAMIEAQEGRKLEAINQFKNTLELEPPDRVQSEVNYRMAEIYVSLGRRDRALTHLTAAASHEPDGPWARKSQEYLKLLQ
jgi:type IV pilus assembly protein PilF